MVFHLHYEKKSVYNHEGDINPQRKNQNQPTQNMSENYSYGSWCFQTIMDDA